MPLHGFPSDSSHKAAGRKDWHLSKSSYQNRLWSTPEDNSTRESPQTGHIQEDSSLLLFIQQIHW